MGPPFQVNFVRGQRVIQMSAAVSEDGQSRMIPVIFDDASTPEEMRTIDAIPWQTVKAYTSGKMHELKVKTMQYLRWRGTGKQHTLQVMIIAPLRYRLSQGSACYIVIRLI
jgi:hypothetical protein